MFVTFVKITYISLPWISNEATLATLRFSNGRKRWRFTFSTLRPLPPSLFHERIFHESPPQRGSPLALRTEEILAEWTRWHVISRGGNSRYPRLSIAERWPRPGCGYYERAEERRGPGVFSMSCNQFAARRISREVLRIFQSTEGSLSAKLHITISRFDVREERRGGSAGCVGTRTHAHPPSHCTSPVYAPCGIRQGYRACSGVLLVVIGVGPTDHLNTRHCNHDSSTPPPSFWSLSFHLALPPDTLFAYRVVIAPSHPRVTRLTVRGIPPDCYRVAPHDILSIRFHRRLAGPSQRYREDSPTTVTLAYRWMPNDLGLYMYVYVYMCMLRWWLQLRF